MFTVAISDGLIPDDRKTGYVLRKIIRRAHWTAFNYFKLSSTHQIFNDLCLLTADIFGDAYPEIQQNIDSVLKVINSEVTKYDANSANVVKQFAEKAANVKNNCNTMSGTDTFKLMLTFGAPKYVIQFLANEHNINIEWEIVDKLIEERLYKTRTRKDERIVNTS